MSEPVLIHHGVKGMKWGVRRYRNTDGTLTAVGKLHAKMTARKEAKENARSERMSRKEAKRMAREERRAEKQAQRAKKDEYLRATKNVRSLTDEELIARIGRLEKEKKLVELTYDNFSGMTPGQKMTRDILTNAGKKVLTAAVAGGAAYAGALIMANTFPEHAELAKQIFPNPNKKK